MVLSLNVRILLATLIACCPLCCFADTVLLDFSSPNCGPCQQMRPVVQRLVADGLPVREVDITRQPQLAAQYRVTQVPTFIVVANGQPVEQTVGLTSYEQLRSMVRRHMPASSPRSSVMPIGQSSGHPTTFAATNTDLSRPQAGRVVSLEDPNPRRPRPQAIANPFSGAPDRPNASSHGSQSSLHQRLLASTVKISVDDPDGKSVGTGTIVDARSGEALVLTCGHLFRSSQGQGEITVTTFQPTAGGAEPGPAYRGKLLDYDLERDLALLTIWPTSPVPAVPIANTAVQPLSPSTPVTSVGCNHGQNPTAIDSRVASIDRYQGPPNVEVQGAPVEGRSGGGLFNAQGQLVGVCYAADPQSNEGLYAGLPSIYAKLDMLKLSMVYQPSAGATANAEGPTTVPPQPQLQVAAAGQVTSVRGQEPGLPSTPIAPQSQPQQAASSAVATLPPAEMAALQEIQRRGLKSEVICIIRPQHPTAKSEVITLNNVSPSFVGALANPSRTAATSQVSASGGILR